MVDLVDDRASALLEVDRLGMIAMALVCEPALLIAAARIAERAGVSVGSLWSHFKDLEALFAAAGEKTLQVQYAHYRPIPPDLPLAERIDRFCRQRVQMLESIAGAARSVPAWCTPC